MVALKINYKYLQRLPSPRRGRPKGGFAGKFLVFAVLLAVLTPVINAIFDAARPIVYEVAANRAQAMITERVENCVRDKDFSGVALISYDKNSAISGVVCDVGKINELKAALSREITRSLENEPVKIPVTIGDVTGSSVAAGRGPRIVVNTTGYAVTSLNVESEIVGAGINQSLYKMKMTVSVECELILPGRKAVKTSVTSEYPLCEAVIVGAVPEFYGKY